MLLDSRPWVKYEPQTGESWGRFVVEPLTRGYGVTLGNSLRRVLLSSLTGAAVTSVRIEGVSHEFSTLPGVEEDVLHMLLNVKQMVVKLYSDQPKVITLKAKGPGEVTAGQIQHDAEVEIINPDLKLATLDTGGKLEMEFTVSKGRGYVTSEENKLNRLSVDTIPVDSIFAPVVKVNFNVEETRVGQDINYDRLVLDVWTNGGIKPDDAVKEAARIFLKHITLFEHIGERLGEAEVSPEGKPEVDQAVLNMSVEELEFSARTLNCLKKKDIKTVGELVQNSEQDLMKVRNFGSKSFHEILEKLRPYGLTLKGAENVVEEIGADELASTMEEDEETEA